MGAIDTTYTFTATDTITSTKMNNIIDQTTFTNDAVFDTTLAVASGKLKVNSQGITSNELAAGSVVTSKITDANVTTVKIADDSIITAKIANLNVTPEKLSQKITSGTSQTATGTFVDFTGIPSWVKKITVMVAGVSTNGSSIPQIQLGTTSGIAATGYLGSAMGVGTGTNAALMSSGFLTNAAGNSLQARHGIATICNVSANTWVCNGVLGNSANQEGSIFAGSVSLLGVLDRIRIAAFNNTDTFDAGSINIMYE